MCLVSLCCGIEFHSFALLTDQADWLKVFFRNGITQSPLNDPLVTQSVPALLLMYSASGGGARLWVTLKTKHTLTYFWRSSQLKSWYFIRIDQWWKSFFFNLEFLLVVCIVIQVLLMCSNWPATSLSDNNSDNFYTIECRNILAASDGTEICDIECSSIAGFFLHVP